MMGPLRLTGCRQLAAPLDRTPRVLALGSMWRIARARLPVLALRLLVALAG